MELLGVVLRGNFEIPERRVDRPDPVLVELGILKVGFDLLQELGLFDGLLVAEVFVQLHHDEVETVQGPVFRELLVGLVLEVSRGRRHELAFGEEDPDQSGRRELREQFDEHDDSFR